MSDDRIIHNPDTGITYVMLGIDDILKCVKLSGDFSKFEAWGGNDASKRDNAENYGAGILNNSKDTRKTERQGLYGEVAFNILTGLPMDEVVREKGNDWDFTYSFKNTYRHLDVKNTGSFRDRCGKGEFMIKNSDWRYGPKKIYPLKSDAYFFTHHLVLLDNSNQKHEIFGPKVSKIIVKMNGAISKKRIESNREERVGPSPISWAKWDNIYVRDSELVRPMDFFRQVGLKVTSFLPYEECFNGIWKGLEQYV